MTTMPPPEIAPLPSHASERFQPETVFDLLKPIETLIENLAREFHGQDLRVAETHRRFVSAVDHALLVREPWSRVVPIAIREALVARLLRTHFWGQGGVLDTKPAA